MNDTQPNNASPPAKPDAQTTKNAGPWLPKFGIAEMMLVTMILCVMGAAGSYLRVALQNNQGRPIFVLFTLASPITLVLVLSGYLTFKRWVRKHL